MTLAPTTRGTGGSVWPTSPAEPVPGRVSVVIPAYNGSRFLGACIDSIRGQGIDDVEIVVVDDGSTDDSVEIARSREVRLVEQANAGVSVARNRGFVESTGEFLVFQDQDDRLVEGGLEHGLRMFRESPEEVGMVFGRTRLVDEHDAVQGEQPIREAPATADAFLAGKVIVPPGIAMFRRRSVLEAGPFDPAWQIVGDLAFYVSVMKVARARSHDEFTVAYRRHGGNVSWRGSEAATLRELLAYLDQERRATTDPARLEAIEIGRRYWTRRFWRSMVTWSIRSAVGGRPRAAIDSAAMALRTAPLRFLGGGPRASDSP